MKPFPYQKECVYELERFNGRSLLALDPGLGKTAIALWYLRRNPEALPAVVVCPASVKWHWEREAERILKLRARVLEGRQANGQLPDRPGLIILNYDILGSWLDGLKGMNPRTVILDEVQYTANRTKRTNASRALCRGRPYVLALSGTPLVNRPIELWNGLQMVRPDVFRHRWGFIQKFCGLKKTYWGWDFKGASNTKKLHRLLSDNCMIRRRKADVLPDLPEKIRQVIPVPISDPDQYRRAEDDFLAWLAGKDTEKAKRAAAAEALTKIGYLLRLAAELKMRSVLEWIDTFLEGGEKLLVFAAHCGIVRAVADAVGEKVGTVVVDGSVTGRKRQVAVGKFQEDEGTRVLIGNIRAAGTGLTLTAASTAVFAELDWAPGRLTQAEDRIHRIGTRSTAWCVYLVARGTIEERLCGIIQRKQQVLTAVLDGGADGEELDVFDRLMGQLGNRQ